MKKLLISAAVIVVVAIGGYAAWQGTKTETGTNTTVQTNQQETTKVTERSLKNLLAAGASVQCTVNEEDTTGTVYIAGENKARVDFTTTSDGKTTSGHMIISGKVGYMWVDGEQSGLKINIDSEDADDEIFDADSDINYDCKAWTKDESKFKVPTDITFIEFNAEGAAAGSGTVNQCAYCDSLSGEQKTSCRTALGCK